MMVRPSHPLAVAASCLAVAQAQFVAPPAADHFTEAIGHANVPIRYREVPTGICELDPSVKSYAGYADVADDQHIFWWFFEARIKDPAQAPLTVWINGGPGASSMVGLFQELGPCGIDYFGEVYDNTYSWSNVSNMLFIDQPNQVGFSYSRPVRGFKNSSNSELVLLRDREDEDCPDCPDCPDYAYEAGTCGTYSLPDPALTANSTRGAAPNFWKTLQGFMGVFPQYSGNGLNIATESYGGHYGPVFGAYILRQNDRLDRVPGAAHIDLRTLLVGNGWFDPIINYQAFYNFTVWPGNTYDLAPDPSSNGSTVLYENLYGPDNCLDQLMACRDQGTDSICAAADSFCSTKVEDLALSLLSPENSTRDELDIRYLSPDPFPYPFYSTDYLRRADVLEAIGAFTNHSSNGAVWRAFASTGDDAREVDSIGDVRLLLARDVTVAIYYGDADLNCNWLGGLAVVHEVVAEGWDDGEAGFVDLQSADGVVHGQVKQVGRLSFTRFFEAGHLVPFYQPLAALELFERAVGGMDVETGREVVGEGYRTRNGTRKTEYWEGNGTVQWGVTPGDLMYDVGTHRPGRSWKERREDVEREGSEYVRGSYPYQETY